MVQRTAAVLQPMSAEPPAAMPAKKFASQRPSVRLAIECRFARKA